MKTFVPGKATIHAFREGFFKEFKIDLHARCIQAGLVREEDSEHPIQEEGVSLTWNRAFRTRKFVVLIKASHLTAHY